LSPRVDLRTKVLYGLGAVAFGVKDNGFSFFLLLYYNQVLGLPNAWVGVGIMTALMIDAVIDPVIGHLSDHLHAAWGRRHPFMYASALPVAVVYWLLWSPPTQTSPAALSLALDWMHVTAGAVWLGGLVGLVILGVRTPAGARVDVLGLVVPRFSRTGLACVLLLIASGVGASIVHLPTVSSLWGTSYGQAILAKVALLACALVAGGINYARTTPRLAAARERHDRGLGESGARLLRRTVRAEVLLVSATVLAAMVLSSLPPPAKALAEVGRASAHVGPGAVDRVIHHGPYTLHVHVDPNRAAQPSTFTLALTQNGRPVTGARVVLQFAMLDMEMGTQSYALDETAPGTYGREADRGPGPWRRLQRSGLAPPHGRLPREPACRRRPPLLPDTARLDA